MGYYKGKQKDSEYQIYKKSLHFQSPQTLIYDKIAWSIIQHCNEECVRLQALMIKTITGSLLFSDDG